MCGPIYVLGIDEQQGKRIGVTLKLNFSVDAEGNNSDIELDKDYLFITNRTKVPQKIVDEAMRIAKLMPKWNPATEWGEPVSSLAQHYSSIFWFITHRLIRLFTEHSKIEYPGIIDTRVFLSLCK